MKKLLPAVVSAAMILTTLLFLPSPANAADLGSNVTPDTSGYGTQSGNTYFAYVNAGEWVYAWGNGGTGTIHAPDGTSYSGGLSGTAFATSRQAATDGVWTFAYGGASYWNVTVYDGDPGFAPGTDPRTATLPVGVHEVTGRVWAESYSIDQSTGKDTLRFWLLNDSGYQYDVVLRDYNGINSTIAANSLGVPQGTADGLECAPSYRSWDADEADAAGLSNGLNLFPSPCATPYRLFFEPPAADLPAQSTVWDPTADGGAGDAVTQVIKPAPLTAGDLAVEELSFTSDGAGTAAGTFRIDLGSRFYGGALLRIDVDDDGDYNGARDRTIRFGAAGDPVDYHFDGRDANGDAISSCQQLHAKVEFDRIGEVHLLQTDVEARTLEMTRVNGPGSPDDTIFWDDTATSPRSNDIKPPSTADGTAGVSSTGGVHGWDYNTNSWGNEKFIDDWAYAPLIAPPTTPITIDRRCLEISKSSEITRDGAAVSGEPAQPGDVVTYTVTMSNTGSTSYTTADPAMLADDLSDVLDDAGYRGDAVATVDGSPVVAPTVTDSRLTWAGPLAAGKSVVVTYSVAVSAETSGADGVVDNEAFLAPDGTPPGDLVDLPPPPTCDPPACATTSLDVARLELVKSAQLNDANGNGVADVGERIDYTFTARNTGAVDLTNVRVTDPKVPATAPAARDIAAGAEGEFTGSYTVTQADVDAGVVHNSATATGSTPDGDVTSAPAEENTPSVARGPALGIQKSAALVDGDGDGKADAGETISYSFVVTNTGNVTVKGITVKDSMVTGLPAPFDLAPGQSRTVQAAPYTVTEADVAAGTLRNVASAVGTGPSGGVVQSAQAAAVTAVDVPDAEPARTKPRLRTKAPKRVAAGVRADGTMRSVRLRDRVSVKHVAGKAKVRGVARLYGPTAKRSKQMCTKANLVGKVSFKTRNGKFRTKGIRVTEPGHYTWVVELRGNARNKPVSHRCGLKSESTVVHRKGYGSVVIGTGFGTPTAAERVAGDAARSAVRRVASVVRVAIRSIGIRPRVATVGIRHGEMDVPGNIDRLGWLNRSAGVGEKIGTTIIAGHVSDNHDRPGAMWRLRKAKVGAVVRIRDSKGKAHRFKITDKSTYLRSKPLPKRLFSTRGKHRVVLVTCTAKVTYPGGGFHYTRNLVVTAKPIR